MRRMVSMMAARRSMAMASVILACAGACAGEEAMQPAIVDEPASPAELETFEQTIPGTTVSFEMVKIPGGTVEVPAADGEGVVEVSVEPIWIGATEVTWEMYDVFVFGLDEPGEDEGENEEADAVTRPSKPYIPPDRGFGHNGWPAISVTFKGADEFCKWLSAKTGRQYRLATDAEWEHAMRAGSDAAYCFGDDPAMLGEYAWYAENADRKTHPVAKKKPNAWGIYDGHGNAGEWCVAQDGSPILMGGTFRSPAAQVAFGAARMKQTAAWNASDPQIPKSQWWLSDGPFAGLRIVCEIE